MRVLFLTAAVLAFGCADKSKHCVTVYKPGDTDESHQCFRACLTEFREHFTPADLADRQLCFSLCPNATPEVVCE